MKQRYTSVPSLGAGRPQDEDCSGRLGGGGGGGGAAALKPTVGSFLGRCSTHHNVQHVLLATIQSFTTEQTIGTMPPPLTPPKQ